MSIEALSHMLYVTKALSNRTRLRVVGVLEGRELCVGQVAAIFDIARSTASEHLAELRRAGLLAERRDGRFVWYSLGSDEGPRGVLAGVLPGLGADDTVRKDREMTDRILALPHDLVCEKGRGALAGETTGRVTPETTATSCSPTSITDVQEDS
jgi:ArsR family transcriptional regulator, arsenate/arsenite/antimonite-responsive transcriptional repressor